MNIFVECMIITVDDTVNEEWINKSLVIIQFETVTIPSVVTAHSTVAFEAL
jgi:hypothetical protein